MNKLNHNYRTMPSLTMAIGLLIFPVIGIIMIYYVYFSNLEVVPHSILLDIITIFMLGIAPFLMLIIVSPKWYVVLTISRDGISSKIFGFIKYKDIKWEEMEEIRVNIMVGGWLFLSKRSLEGVPYNQIMKRKDQIQIAYSKKIIEIIREYTDKEIIGLSEDE